MSGFFIYFFAVPDVVSAGTVAALVPVVLPVVAVVPWVDTGGVVFAVASVVPLVSEGAAVDSAGGAVVVTSVVVSRKCSRQ